MIHRIYDILPTGEVNAIHAEELAHIAGVSLRELRKEIESERRDGALILACSKGYFRHEPGDLPELRRFIQLMERRGYTTFAVIRAAKTALAQEEEAKTQISL
ncbi:MAG: hypothetical protein LUH03_03760 [Oscillospiraceae bacterium]|nr:hypothetical protein [Oscillospiraceae bacterium]